MSSKLDASPLHTPRDDRSPFFITGAPAPAQRSTKTDVQQSAKGLASLTQQVNAEVKRRLTPQQYSTFVLALFMFLIDSGFLLPAACCKSIAQHQHPFGCAQFI